MFKKFISLILTFLMIFTFPMNAFAQENDYTTHWANSIIEKWKSKEIVKGYDDGSYKPNKDITRAEFAQILVSIFGYSSVLNSKTYSDVREDDWFYKSVNLISSTKLMYDFNEAYFRPNEKLTREEAIFSIAKAYKVVGKTDIIFKDKEDISPWAQESVAAMHSHKYIQGTPDGRVMPKKGITRAELLTIINNITASLINEKGEYNKDVNGNLVVNTRDVILKDMTILGDLFLAEGIGDGDVTLDNIVVKGNVIVAGGGQNSIKSKNSNYYNSFIVNAKNPVRVVVDGNSVKIEIDSSVNVTLSGSFSEINVAPNTNVQLSDATVEKINVIPANPNDGEVLKASTIVLDDKSKVTTIIADNAVNIEGSGTISNININVDGVEVNQKVESVNIAEGVVAEIEGKEVGSTSGSGTSNPGQQPDPNPGPQPEPNPEPEPEQPVVSNITKIQLIEQLFTNEKIKGLLVAPTEDELKVQYFADWNELTEEQQIVVAWLIKSKILYENPEVKLNPNYNVKRSELAKIVVDLLLGRTGLENIPTDIVVEDINDHWAKEYILAFIKEGLADGIYQSPKFYPNELLKSDVLTKAITNIVKYIDDKGFISIKDKYYVTGAVVYGGEPVENVEVTIYSNGISRRAITDTSGKFSFYIDSKIKYSIKANIIDTEDYGYRTSKNLPKLFSNTNVELKLEKSPVQVYSAVDKHGVAVNHVIVHIKDNIGNFYSSAQIDKSYENSRNIVFSTDYSNNSYKLMQYSNTGEMILTDLENTEVVVNKVDDFKTEIKVILKDYGLDSTTLTGKMISIHDIPAANVRVFLNVFDKDGKRVRGQGKNALTDENGNYTFEDLDSQNYSYEINGEDIEINNIYYTTSSQNDIRFNKDIVYLKSYAIKVRAFDKNGVIIDDAALQMVSDGGRYSTSQIGSTCVIAGPWLKPGVCVATASLNVDGNMLYSIKSITIIEGQYEAYECILIFEDYEVPTDKIATISGNVFITTGTAITTTGTAITAEMASKVTIKLKDISGNVLFDNIKPNTDGSFIISNVRIPEYEDYKIFAELTYEGKIYFYQAYIDVDRNNVTHNILLTPIN